MRAYSMDLRERVLAACDGGMTTAEVAEAFAVSPAWVRRLKQRREGGEVPAPVAPRRPPPSWAAHADRIRAEVRAAPDATLAERTARLKLGVSLATLCRALQAVRLTLKKSPAGGRAGPAGRWRSSGMSGGGWCRASIRTSSCSSTRRGPPPTWPGGWGGARPGSGG